jgi:hypothetical protein
VITEARVLEHVVRRAPLGLRLWDIARATHLADGLEIDVSLRTRPEISTRAFINRSGIYCATGLPGLRQFESAAKDEEAWTAALRLYRIEIHDPQDRFLPIAFDAELPVRGLFENISFLMSPPAAIPMFGSPPALLIEGVPLFSTPSRPTPEPFAVVRAQLRELSSERPASWCLVTVSVDAKVRGMGLADRDGRVAVLFPYPDRPRPTLTSPPFANNDFRWNVELTAYYEPRPLDTPAPVIADLAAIFAQLDSPRPLYRSVASPPHELPLLQLEYRLPLTVRTEVGPTGPSSYLYVGTA